MMCIGTILLQRITFEDGITKITLKYNSNNM